MQGMLGDLNVFSNSLILVTMDREHCLQAVLEHKVPNLTHTGIENWNMYAIKQIEVCTEYRDIVTKAPAGLSGTPGLRPIGLSPGSWQTRLGLGYHVPVFYTEHDL